MRSLMGIGIELSLALKCSCTRFAAIGENFVKIVASIVQ